MQTSGWNSLWCDAYYYYYCADSPQTTTFHVKTMNPRNPTNEWFNPNNFSSEPIGTFGNTRRNYFHGPGYDYTNFELAKDFPIHEQMSLELHSSLQSLQPRQFCVTGRQLQRRPWFVCRHYWGDTAAWRNWRSAAGTIAVQLAAKFYF